MHSDIERLQEAARPSGNGELTAPRLGDLLDTIENTITTYVLLPAPGLAMLTALWSAGTYCYEAFHFYGYLTLRSATPRCGKTRLLRMLRLFVNGSPAITTQPTPAVLYRTTRKVLLMDEVDKLRNKNKDQYGEVVNILNTGFEAGGIVERVEKSKGGQFEVKEYLTYGPKALAGIESLADTLADRAFMVQMQRTPTRMQRLNVRRLDDTVRDLRVALAQWAAVHEREVQATYEGLPDELGILRKFDDRFQDISESLIVLAMLADAERTQGPLVMPRLLEGLKAAAGRREPSGREQELMAFLTVAEEKLAFAKERFVSSVELVEACSTVEDLARIESPRRLKGFPGPF